MLQLKPDSRMRFLFRVKAVVVIYQDVTYKSDLERFKSWLKLGALYVRNDRIAELRIEGFQKVHQLLSWLHPYLVIKQKQASYALKALSILQKPYQLRDFLNVCQIADAISKANYRSSHRKYTAKYVELELKKHGLIPVTTGSLC